MRRVVRCIMERVARGRGASRRIRRASRPRAVEERSRQKWHSTKQPTSNNHPLLTAHSPAVSTLHECPWYPAPCCSIHHPPAALAEQCGDVHDMHSYPRSSPSPQSKVYSGGWCGGRCEGRCDSVARVRASAAALRQWRAAYRTKGSVFVPVTVANGSVFGGVRATALAHTVVA